MEQNSISMVRPLLGVLTTITGASLVLVTSVVVYAVSLTALQLMPSWISGGRDGTEEITWIIIASGLGAWGGCALLKTVFRSPRRRQIAYACGCVLALATFGWGAAFLTGRHGDGSWQSLLNATASWIGVWTFLTDDRAWAALPGRRTHEPGS